MKKSISPILSIMILFSASLACTLFPTREAEQQPDLDPVATAVAATITAAALESAPPAELDLIPTNTPESIPAIPAVFRIVYNKDGNVWSWQPGEVPLALTSTGDVNSLVISDDGLKVVITRQLEPAGVSLWVVNTDGSDLRQLVDSTEFDAMATHPDALSAVPYTIDWVPGSHIVAFNTRLLFEGPGLMLNNDLRLVNAETGSLSTLLAPGEGGEFYFSPDGSLIALVTPDQINLVDASGGTPRTLLDFPVVITYSEFNFYPVPVWTPNSAALHVAIPPEDPLFDPSAQTTLWHLPVDGSDGSILFRFGTTSSINSPPLISPNAGRIAYMKLVNVDDPNLVELHIANVNGTEDILYETGNLLFIAWSPDGEHFFFSEIGNNPKLGRVGSSPLNLPGVNNMQSVRWVNNTRFLYLNRSGDNWELWLRELGSPGQLIDSTAGDFISYDFTR